MKHLDSEKRIRAVDLFCGAGGLSEGLRLAGVHTVVASDSDPWAGATFADNHSKHGTHFILGDIRQARIRREIIAAAEGEIDLLAGGPPCQAFSQVRNHDRATEDPRNSLYRQLVSMIDELRPKAFLMENVVGMQNIEGGSVWERMQKDLSIGGRYRVDSRILDAADFGVPQTRRRVVIIGVRADIKVAPLFPLSRSAADKLQLVRNVTRRGRISYELPAGPEHLPSQFDLLEPSHHHMVAKLLNAQSLDLVTVSQAIGDLVGLLPAERLERKPSNTSTKYPARPTSAYQRLMRGDLSEVFNADVPSIREDTVRRLDAIPPGGNFRDIPEHLQARYLDGTKWGPDLGRETLSRKHYYAYRKLHPDYFSWTLNTKTDCVYHYSEPRALSVREFARLHSFPDHYRFINGDRHSRYRQVGNAVPPLLARAIATALMPIFHPYYMHVAEVTATASVARERPRRTVSRDRESPRARAAGHLSGKQPVL